MVQKSDMVTTDTDSSSSIVLSDTQIVKNELHQQ